MDKGTNKQISGFIASIAEQNPRFLMAYLFGSYARNSPGTDNDIDIALVVDGLNDEEKFDLQVQLMLKSAGYDTRIEPHLVSSSDFNSGNPFVEEIKRTGIMIEPWAPETWYAQ